MNTPEPEVQFGVENIDVEALVATLQQRVAEKRRAGAWSDPRIARAEKHNLLNLKDDDEYLSQFLDCLRQVIQVDINDFEIIEKRRFIGKPLVKFKKTIWGLLRFYTYRLWSQQNQTNSLLFSAIDLLNRQNTRRIKDLETRVAELEKKLGEKK